MGHLLQFIVTLALAALSSSTLLQDQSILKKTDVSTGCGQSLPQGAVPGALGANISITSHGIDRWYLLHVPLGYNNTKPAPLYFSFHGANRDAPEQEGLSQFSNNDFNPNGIAVYPQGLNQRWLSNPDESVAHFFPNDLDFMLDLLDQLNSTLCIDSSRVYAAGKSNGGGFTNVIACNSTVGPRFAAFAAVSGAFYDDHLVTGIGPCSPGTTSTPFIEFHGLQDCTAIYDGRSGKPGQGPKYTQIGVPGFLEQWLRLNNCPGAWNSPTSSSPAYGGNVTIESWSCGANSSRIGLVTHYKEDGLGHIWPSLQPNDDCNKIKSDCGFGPQCPFGHYVYDGTPVIFDFFGGYSLPSSRK